MPPAASPESSADFLQQLQPGQRLAGCYLLSRQINAAPDRVVWLATDEVLGKDVALHFLPQTLIGDSAVAERLRQEVKRNRPLIHPHILRTYDFIEEEGWSAISTDAFEGQTLAARLEDGGREVAEITRWIQEICETLDDAHRIRIVHAGLTPSDIAVSSMGGIHVMNFGISAVLREAVRSTNSEANQAALSYTSPEQLAGSKATVADDIFALGALVHALLTGEPPFRGADRQTSPPGIAAHRRTLGHRGDPVPPSWERAVAAALQQDPTRRPASASQWWELTLNSTEDESAAAATSAFTDGPIPTSSEATPHEPPAREPSVSVEADTPQRAEADSASNSSELAAEETGKVQAEPVLKSQPAAKEGRAETVSDKGQTTSAAESSGEAPAPFESETAAKPSGRRNRSEKPDVLENARGSEKAASPREKASRASAVPTEKLHDQVRREEAEDEARGRGYYGGDDEVYIRPRGRGGARMILPIVGAAAGLLALFWVIKLLVGTPDTTSSRSTTAPATSTAETSDPKQPDAVSTPGTTAAGEVGGTSRDPGKTASLPDPDPSRVDPAAERPAAKPVSEPAPANAAPPPRVAEVDPVQVAAEEHQAAVQKVSELESKLASAKKEIAEKSKSLPAVQKSGDEAAQQKKRDDAARKAELAAEQAEQAATEKRRMADEARKAANDLAEQIKARREELTKTQELLSTLQTSIGEDEKALAEAKNAAAAAAEKRQQLESQKPAVVETPSLASPAPEKEDSEAAKARNEERKRIDEEMAALRKKLAEQAQKLGATLDAARSPEPAPADSKEPAPPLPTRTEPPEQPATSAPAPATELAMNKTGSPSLAESGTKSPDTAKTPKVGADGEFMNSLGMKFVPVPGSEAVFCIWPTRLRDFEPFARSAGLKSTLWKDPGFKQGPEHPVVNVTWQEAIAFCKWLTAKEQKEGLIPPGQAYRLPTDLEWSIAVGITNESGRTPEARDMSILDVYPWGTSWPPPAASGNYTGEETGSDVAIKGYDDGFPWTSPVGSFPANKFGLFDMGGNVWEWCMDTWNTESKARVLRGASWYNGALKLSLLSSCRVHASPDSGTDNYGFRLVLAPDAAKAKR